MTLTSHTKLRSSVLTLLLCFQEVLVSDPPILSEFVFVVYKQISHWKLCPHCKM
jgi:hypothetical protein